MDYNATYNIRFTHGTAKTFQFSSVVPADKIGKEIFWTTKVFNKYYGDERIADIRLCEDDSNGKADVLLKLDGKDYGVQVTELTDSRTIVRNKARNKFINEVISEIVGEGIKSEKKLLLTILTSPKNTRKFNMPSKDDVIKHIKERVKSDEDRTIMDNDFRYIFKYTSDNFLVENSNNIGLEINIDSLPVTDVGYMSGLDEIYKRKNNSTADFLLIWTTKRQYFSPSHFPKIISHFNSLFKDNSFKAVFFADSMDFDRGFDVNLKIESVENPYTP